MLAVLNFFLAIIWVVVAVAANDTGYLFAAMIHAVGGLICAFFEG